MGMQQGRFVWYEVMTTDVEAAKAFYTETIGWKITQWGEGEKAYSMWNVGDQPIGGVMTLPEEAKAAGAPPHWVAYIWTSDVDAVARKTEELGGKVIKAPFDIPEVGRTAVLADRQGVIFMPFASKDDMPLHEGAPRPGDFSWHELNTTDWKDASQFYSALFGWEENESMDMGPEFGTYWMYRYAGGKNNLGGFSNVAKVQKVPAHWLYYVTVEDIDATIERVKARGGKVMNGPMEVPGGDKVAQCMDPQGAMFALHCAKAG